MKKATAQTGVRVLQKALDILEAIKSQEGDLGLSQLARTVKLPKATVHRIVVTLERRGYLDRHAGGYRVGRKLFDRQTEESFEKTLARISEPILKELVASCRETVNLGVLDGGDVVVINTVESPQSIRMSSKIGKRRYLHATALGKVLLAGLTNEEALRLAQLKGLPRLTPNTLVTAAAILKEIQRVRKQGYAIDDEENEKDGRCIAAPIMAADDRVSAALSISGPLYRMDMSRINSLVSPLQNACSAISNAIRSDRIK